jgi:hypothetical protein
VSGQHHAPAVFYPGKDPAPIAVKALEIKTQDDQSLHNLRGTLLVVQLVKALFYKPESREFDPRWCQWNFSLT